MLRNKDDLLAKWKDYGFMGLNSHLIQITILYVPIFKPTFSGTYQSLSVVKNQRMENTQVWGGLYILEMMGKAQVAKWL